ncbi:MAG: TrmH family RNA methyltransferase [Saprospiraceae bacterium]|nr:TrmH family RNA methyltransferase [Saprospiraceae bacterium]
MDLLLFAPEYRPNLSSMIRTAEFYGFKRIYIYDKNDLIKPPTNKKGRANMAHMAKVWTAGAIDFIDIIRIENPVEFFENYEGRKVGTIINETAKHLNDFKFEPNDLLIFGSEKDGLTTETINLLDEAVYIPAIGHTDCLNVAVTFGIVVHQALK